MAELFYLAKIGEINLKKGNLKDFERRLAQNFRSYFDGATPNVQVRAGRMYVRADEALQPRVEAALNHLFGITSWAQAKPADKTLEAISETAVTEAKDLQAQGARTFKIEARRADKQFPLTSYDIAREVGGTIHTAGILTVDVHNPDAVISIEVREKQAFIYGVEHTGRRGLPCGCSGRALLLLSGGIDSPVAGYKMLFRGMKVDYVYFHSHPYTSPEAQQKVETLAGILARYGLGGYMTVVSFTKVQQHLKRTVPEPYLTLLLRMCMMHTAEMLAEKSMHSAWLRERALRRWQAKRSKTLRLPTAVQNFRFFVRLSVWIRKKSYAMRLISVRTKLPYYRMKIAAYYFLPSIRYCIHGRRMLKISMRV